ncbi:Phosphate-binding protein PstS 1 precursor [Caulifigura coniformis]|uniref:Phosphate-binding protein PstS 1 n=1 Tax=Caulifigura coniformis TaxID=2527983 RepID=A0A517S9Z2_9PLAN|nr:substrate-binding domain-containing protein [Caulifigura coniformis]QDT52947.1 Phosphate-binding protein PstS 1 precursor [Caulifigura coniformis]
MKKFLAWIGTATLVLGIAADSARAQAPMVDSHLPAYRPVSALNGEITIAGSDAMMQLAGVWVQQFSAFYPNVKFNLVSASSTRSVEAVRDKQAHFALMSREVLPEEKADFKKVTGHDPTIVISSMERIAVLVNANSPVESLTLTQLDSIFSATRKRGGEAAANWSALGTQLNAPVKVIIRDEPTGAPATFRQVVMAGEEFRTDAAKMDSYINVAKAVAADPGAISFAGNMYILRGTKAIAVSIADGQKAIGVDSPEADAGMYPLVRPQHMLVNYNPKSPPSEAEKEFYKFIFSTMGQEGVVKSGFQPVTSAPARVALEAVGLNSLN